MPRISVPRLHDFGSRIFVGAGVSLAVAERVMHNLVRANVYGIQSHGVVRLADYVRAVQSGRVRADAQPSIVSQSAVTALLDGSWCFGQVVAERAMPIAIEKAKANGVAIVCAERGEDPPMRVER